MICPKHELENGMAVVSSGSQSPSILDGLQWYCLRSHPKREHFAAATLQPVPGVEVFCPRIRFRKVTRRGPVWFLEAMFPGYLFARFDYVHLHALVEHASGVSGILHFGKRVVAVGDDVMGSLRARFGNSGHIPIIEIDPSIRVGDPVNIAEGAFSGLESVVTQVLSGKDRVRILIDFLGRQVEAELGKMSIVRLGSARETL